MKYLLICMLLSSNLALAADEETYADGYEKGYQDAHCNYSSYCTPPVAPVPPVPSVGKDSRDAGYHDGYEKAEKNERRTD